MCLQLKFTIKNDCMSGTQDYFAAHYESKNFMNNACAWDLKNNSSEIYLIYIYIYV